MFRWILKAMLAVLMGVLPGWAAAQQGPCRVPDRVPRLLFDIAGRDDVGHFAAGLSRMEISGGFIVPNGSGLKSAEWGRWWNVEFDVDDTVPIADALARFGAAHPEYVVTMHDNMVGVSHIDLADPSILQPVVVNFAATELYPTVAFTRAMRLIDPSIRDYGNIVVGSGPMPPLGGHPKVSLVTGETTVRGVFDAIACAVPGTVWELTNQQHPTRGSYFTLMILKPWGGYNNVSGPLFPGVVNP